MPTLTGIHEVTSRMHLRTALGIGSIACAILAWLFMPSRTGNDYSLLLVFVFGPLAVFGAAAWAITSLIHWIATRPRATPPMPEKFDISRYNRDRRMSDAPYTRIVAVAEKLFSWFAAAGATWLAISAAISFGIQGESFRWVRRSESFVLRGPERWFFIGTMLSASVFAMSGVISTLFHEATAARLKVLARWAGRASVAFLILSFVAHVLQRIGS
jgi:hypothetical protein